MKKPQALRRLYKYRWFVVRLLISIIVVTSLTVAIGAVHNKFKKPEAPTSPGAVVYQDGTTLLAQVTEISVLNSSEPTSYIQMTMMQASLPKSLEVYKKSRENSKKDEQYNDANTQIEGSSKKLESLALDIQQRYSIYQRAIEYSFNEDLSGLDSGQEALARLDQTESALKTIKSGKSPAKNGSVNVTITTPQTVSTEIDATLQCIAELKQQQGSLQDKAENCESVYTKAKSAMIADISGVANTEEAKTLYANFASDLRGFKS